MNDFFNELRCGDPAGLAGRVKHIETKSFPTLGEDCMELDEEMIGFCLSDSVNMCAQILYFRHFGFRGTLPVEQIIAKGIHMAKKYFAHVGDDLAKAGPDMKWDEEIAWFKPYSEALLLATLSGDTKARTEFSDCLHPNLVVEGMAIPIEPALGDVLLCVAASFQSTPMDTAPLEERLQKSRKKHPKLLFKAWRALQSDDPSAFASSIADSTANFAKTTAEDNLPLNAIALLESILVGLAYERGWTDLSFDLPIAARLVTRQSLELD